MRALVSVLLCALWAPIYSEAAPQGRTPRFSSPPPSEWVHIDGSKNPELIPEWSIWQRGLQILARSSALPTTILQQFTSEESALLKKETAEELARDAACQRRVLKLAPLLAMEKARILDEKTKVIQLDCRQQTLDARDRLLARISPGAQVALAEWIEALKAGTRVSIPKKELAHYLQPR